MSLDLRRGKKYNNTSMKHDKKIEESLVLRSHSVIPQLLPAKFFNRTKASRSKAENVIKELIFVLNDFYSRNGIEIKLK